MIKNGEYTNFAVVMIDLNYLKDTNDTYGHDTGDIVLIKLAEMMQTISRQNVPDSSVGRWGGEEFMILLPDTDVKKASIIAELLRVSFATIDFGKAGFQTISLGVTQFIPDEEADTYCMRVDTALYQGKRNGKNQVVVI